MAPASSVAGRQGLAMVAIAFVVGCSGVNAPRPATVTKQPPSAEELKLTDQLHARLVQDAQNNYTPGPDKPAIPVPKGSLDHGSPVQSLSVIAHAMERSSSAGPEVHHFVGMFVSNKKYSRLGMGSGENYVLMLPEPQDTIYVMVPSDLKIPMKLLTYDLHSTFYHSAHEPPQVVSEVVSSPVINGVRVDELVIGGCVEGPCPTGHCGISGVSDAFLFSNYQDRMERARRP